MNKSELAKLYGKFTLFTEAFTSYKHEQETMHNVYEENDTVKMDFYKVTFNPQEFMTLSELCQIADFMKDVLVKNGIDTSKIPEGREDFSDTTFEGMTEYFY